LKYRKAYYDYQILNQLKFLPAHIAIPVDGKDSSVSNFLGILRKFLRHPRNYWGNSQEFLRTLGKLLRIVNNYCNYQKF
jgi:hypothetical protein